MGYRSEVAYVIKFNDLQARDAYVTLMLGNDNKYVREAIEECDHDCLRDPIITFKDDYTKWYDSFPEVQAHTFIYRNAYELGLGSYRFVALGEDGAEQVDVEELEDCDLSDYIYARHYLHTDF